MFFLEFFFQILKCLQIIFVEFFEFYYFLSANPKGKESNPATRRANLSFLFKAQELLRLKLSHWDRTGIDPRIIRLLGKQPDH